MEIHDYELLLPRKTLVRVCPIGVVGNALDCNIVVSEFELQSCYHVHFRTNTLWKRKKL